MIYCDPPYPTSSTSLGYAHNVDRAGLREALLAQRGRVAIVRERVPPIHAALRLPFAPEHRLRALLDDQTVRAHCACGAVFVYRRAGALRRAWLRHLREADGGSGATVRVDAR